VPPPRFSCNPSRLYQQLGRCSLFGKASNGEYEDEEREAAYVKRWRAPSKPAFRSA